MKFRFYSFLIRGELSLQTRIRMFRYFRYKIFFWGELAGRGTYLDVYDILIKLINYVKSYINCLFKFLQIEI